MSTFARPLPLVDVYFIWSHFNTVSLSSDTSSCSQYSKYTLKILTCFCFNSNSQSFNVLNVNEEVNRTNVKKNYYVAPTYHQVHNTVKWGDCGPFLSHVTKQQTVTKVSTMVQFVDVHCSLNTPSQCPYLSTFNITLPLCVDVFYG